MTVGFATPFIISIVVALLFHSDVSFIQLVEEHPDHLSVGGVAEELHSYE